MKFVFVIFAMLVTLPKPEMVAKEETPDGRVMVDTPPESMVRFPLVRSEEKTLP
jgi:hypothetical protein